MRAPVLLAVALAGCSNLLGIDHFSTASDDGGADAPMADAPANQPDGPLVDAPANQPDAPLIDARSDAMVDASPPDAMVVADFTMSLSGGVAHTPLGTQVQYTVTVTSSNLVGTVNLVPENVPASWNASVAPASVTLASGDVKTATLTVTVPTQTTELSAPTLGVAGAGGGKNHDAQSALAIDNFVVILFTADGVGGNFHNLPPTMDIALGASVHFVNQDGSSQHEVHANGTGGFMHQSGGMSAGQEYDVTPNAAGTYPYYCHIHGTATGQANLVVH
jgi:plastocyanin